MKAKKIFAIGSLAAIALTATAASATTAYLDHGIWKYGTTGLCGSGTVYSKYYDWDYTYSQASVKNAKGVYRKDVQRNAQASASAKAYAFQVDHAYYDFY